MPKEKQKHEQYNRFASVYDAMNADMHSKLMVEYCHRIFKKHGIRPEIGLDLCCGTGTAIDLLSQLGIKMSGLDGSSYMLAQAAKKLKGRKIKLYHKQLPNFKLLDTKSGEQCRFDLITCFYDSLNYLLTQRDLKRAFKSVHSHLKEGGWFVFDMNTLIALRTLWDGQVYAGEKEGIAWIWRNEYDAKKERAHVHATFFEEQRNGKWERFEEVHTERAYSNPLLKKLLREVGFAVKGYYRCYQFASVARDTYRICAVVQKR
ncbi:MAG: class I SAM-dependent methyltransferase [bacterium]|nr:class I SAM-dependent methyltransferase [bacterium]